jgi:hypothetical protein
MRWRRGQIPSSVFPPSYIAALGVHAVRWLMATSFAMGVARIHEVVARPPCPGLSVPRAGLAGGGGVE